MATIDDLPIDNFSSLSDDQLKELILQVRGRRRSPDPEIVAQSRKKATSKAKKGKPMALTNVDQLLAGLSKEEAAKLLAQLRKV